ncbi:MAG: LacI family DNA-binding transcriptional regulator [Bacteroidales bacterium]
MEQKKRTSLKDIANHVGVSTALVSYVLNGLEKEKRVSPEIVQKIKSAVKELNYTPNQIARSLRKGSTMTIGFIVADIANPFFGNLVRYVGEEAFKYGYTVLIGSSDENKNKTESLINTFMDHQVDGFIIVPTEGSENQIQILIEKRVPFVLLDRYFPNINTSYVILDNYNATYEAVNFLVSKSYKKIGFIAFKTKMIHMQERIRGYKESMKDNDLEMFISIKEARYDYLKKDIGKLIYEFTSDENKYDAIILATNNITIATLYEILDLNIRIPDELAIIGFDGNEAYDFFYSPITFIQQPLEEMGRTSVNMLISQIKEASNIKHLEISHKLIIRDSTK